MKNKKDIQRLFEEVKLEAKKLNIPISNNIKEEIVINKRAKSRFGCCKKIREGLKVSFEIEISERILACDDRIIKQTLAHELLHTCARCDNHGEFWKYYAEQMNKTYGYKISRVARAESLGIESKVETRTLEDRYIVVCEKCGQRIARTRMSNVIKYPNLYRCRCGGHLTRIK